MERALRYASTGDFVSLRGALKREPMTVARARGPCGCSPLHLSVEGAHLDCIAQLCEALPDLIITVDDAGFTPIDYAASLNDLFGLQVMLRYATPAQVSVQHAEALSLRIHRDMEAFRMFQEWKTEHSFAPSPLVSRVDGEQDNSGRHRTIPIATHVVVEGDSLESLCFTYGTTPRELRVLNGSELSTSLGSAIRVPLRREIRTAPPVTKHLMRAGHVDTVGLLEDTFSNQVTRRTFTSDIPASGSQDFVTLQHRTDREIETASGGLLVNQATSHTHRGQTSASSSAVHLRTASTTVHDQDIDSSSMPSERDASSDTDTSATSTDSSFSLRSETPVQQPEMLRWQRHFDDQAQAAAEARESGDGAAAERVEVERARDQVEFSKFVEDQNQAFNNRRKQHERQLLRNEGRHRRQQQRRNAAFEKAVSQVQAEGCEQEKELDRLTLEAQARQDTEELEQLAQHRRRKEQERKNAIDRIMLLRDAQEQDSTRRLQRAKQRQQERQAREAEWGRLISALHTENNASDSAASAKLLRDYEAAGARAQEIERSNQEEAERAAMEHKQRIDQMEQDAAEQRETSRRIEVAESDAAEERRRRRQMAIDEQVQEAQRRGEQDRIARLHEDQRFLDDVMELRKRSLATSASGQADNASQKGQTYDQVLLQQEREDEARRADRRARQRAREEERAAIQKRYAETVTTERDRRRREADEARRIQELRELQLEQARRNGEADREAELRLESQAHERARMSLLQQQRVQEAEQQRQLEEALSQLSRRQDGTADEDRLLRREKREAERRAQLAEDNARASQRRADEQRERELLAVEAQRRGDERRAEELRRQQADEQLQFEVEQRRREEAEQLRQQEFETKMRQRRRRAAHTQREDDARARRNAASEAAAEDQLAQNEEDARRHLRERQRRHDEAAKTDAERQSQTNRERAAKEEHRRQLLSQARHRADTMKEQELLDEQARDKQHYEQLDQQLRAEREMREKQLASDLRRLELEAEIASAAAEVKRQRSTSRGRSKAEQRAMERRRAEAEKASIREAAAEAERDALVKENEDRVGNEVARKQLLDDRAQKRARAAAEREEQRKAELEARRTKAVDAARRRVEDKKARERSKVEEQQRRREEQKREIDSKAKATQAKTDFERELARLKDEVDEMPASSKPQASPMSRTRRTAKSPPRFDELLERQREINARNRMASLEAARQRLRSDRLSELRAQEASLRGERVDLQRDASRKERLLAIQRRNEEDDLARLRKAESRGQDAHAARERHIRLQQEQIHKEKARAAMRAERIALRKADVVRTREEVLSSPVDQGSLTVHSSPKPSLQLRVHETAASRRAMLHNLRQRRLEYGRSVTETTRRARDETSISLHRSAEAIEVSVGPVEFSRLQGCDFDSLAAHVSASGSFGPLPVSNDQGGATVVASMHDTCSEFGIGTTSAPECDLLVVVGGAGCPPNACALASSCVSLAMAGGYDALLLSQSAFGPHASTYPTRTSLVDVFETKVQSRRGAVLVYVLGELSECATDPAIRLDAGEQIALSEIMTIMSSASHARVLVADVFTDPTSADEVSFSRVADDAGVSIFARLHSRASSDTFGTLALCTCMGSVARCSSSALHDDSLTVECLFDELCATVEVNGDAHSTTACSGLLRASDADICCAPWKWNRDLPGHSVALCGWRGILVDVTIEDTSSTSSLDWHRLLHSTQNELAAMLNDQLARDGLPNEWLCVGLIDDYELLDWLLPDSPRTKTTPVTQVTWSVQHSAISAGSPDSLVAMLQEAGARCDHGFGQPSSQGTAWNEIASTRLGDSDRALGCAVDGTTHGSVDDAIALFAATSEVAALRRHDVIFTLSVSMLFSKQSNRPRTDESIAAASALVSAPRSVSLSNVRLV